MKCLSIFMGHEHILGDKIPNFGTRALATYSVEFIAQYVCIMQST